MHLRLTAINNLMTFLDAHENPRYVDVYDSGQEGMGAKVDLGELFVTGKDGWVVLSRTEARSEALKQSRSRLAV